MSNKLVKNNKALDEISEKIDEVRYITFKKCMDIVAEKGLDICVRTNLTKSNKSFNEIEEIIKGYFEICNPIIERSKEIAEHCEVSNDVSIYVELYDENSMLFKSTWNNLRVLFKDINLNDEIKQLWLDTINSIWTEWILFIQIKYKIKSGKPALVF